MIDLKVGACLPPCQILRPLVPIMKNPLAIVFLLCSLLSSASADVLDIELGDGERMLGKLHLPVGAGPIAEVVIFVHGTGPNTYLNKRKIGKFEFSYYGMFGAEFAARGVAMFSYNKRGVTLGEKPPSYEQVDREKFREVVPSVEVRDLGTVIRHLRSLERLREAKLVLLGWSEGTMIASLVAAKQENRVAALLLAGYAHENMLDIIKWQLSGKSSMIALSTAFDQDADGRVTAEEFGSERESAAAMRKQFAGASFASIDVDGDGFIGGNDFYMQLKDYRDTLIEKIESGDGDWVWSNYFRVSIEWLVEHFDLEPNKQRMLLLDLPIFIFHGEVDVNVPASSVRALKASFEKAGKSNLQTFLFDGHDHDLNFLQWLTGDKPSPGIAKIFAVAESLKSEPKSEPAQK
jgi:pimeloyl-ACP methyl ester carboxylesterase